MHLPLIQSNQSASVSSSAIDDFMERPSRLLGLYIFAAYGFGGVLLGLSIHSFSQFRAVAIVVALVIAVLLVGCVAYPVLQERMQAMQRSGAGPIYPGSKGRPTLIDGSVLLTILTPLAAFVLLIVVGFFIGMR